jgi:hypothetical protein
MGWAPIDSRWVRAAGNGEYRASAAVRSMCSIVEGETRPRVETTLPRHTADLLPTRQSRDRRQTSRLYLGSEAEPEASDRSVAVLDATRSLQRTGRFLTDGRRGRFLPDPLRRRVFSEADL